MSASQTPQAGGSAKPATAADPSMEDILASIRRILSEDDAATPSPPPPAAELKSPATPAPLAAPAAAEEKGDGVLVLDESMLVDEPAPSVSAQPDMMPPEPAAPAAPPQAEYEPMPEPVSAMTAEPPVVTVEPAPTPEPAETELVAPEVAAAAASSVGSLLRTIAGSRATRTHAGGPTIEDIVREELRPLLKDWLDTHLTPIVERLVRAEIERVVNRAVP